MRLLTDHIVNPANETLKIAVVDKPGAGGANHRYDVTGFSTDSNPSKMDEHGYCSTFSRLILIFQNGPIPENGTNGITHEALLAILADRLRAFQAGRYACPENESALAHIEAAQNALQTRTRRRMDAGIEGTHALDPTT